MDYLKIWDFLIIHLDFTLKGLLRFFREILNAFNYSIKCIKSS